jgi:predicted membrane metal-binding protein
VTLRAPYVLATALCGGLAGATVLRATAAPAVVLLGLAALGGARAPLGAAACALALAGWWWGSERLRMLDRSALAPRIGTAERATVELEEPPRPGRFETRVRALVVRWGGLRPREPVLLELPPGRAPPQGARLSVLGQLRAPRGPAHGFDERAWLRRHGVHVVLRVDAWRRVGSRGGLGGVADRLHAWLARDGAPGLRGERRGVIEGVVLGEDQDLSDTLKQRFRASGLYHLLAVCQKGRTKDQPLWQLERARAALPLRVDPRRQDHLRPLLLRGSVQQLVRHHSDDGRDDPEDRAHLCGLL